MTEIQQNRWDQLIRRVANIVAGGSQVNETLNELFPMLDVETDKGELQLLAGTRLCLGASNLTAAAGETSKIQVFNPAGSGNIITITRVIIASGATQTIRWAEEATARATTVATQVYRDSRLPLVDRPIGTINQESSAGFPDANGSCLILANDPFTLEDPNGVQVLAPGAGFTVGHTTPALPFFVTFYWRERAAEAAELNF